MGLRNKFLIGSCALVAITLAIGIESIIYLDRLGGSIDVILRENYRSVIACQNMKEALERMDSGLLFSFAGEGEAGADLVEKNDAAFAAALKVELGNVTLPGEGERADRLARLFTQYRNAIGEVRNLEATPGKAREAYFSTVLPIFTQIKQTADEILQMNQANMLEANDRARRAAASARRSMYALLLAGVVVAFGLVLLTGRWILQPVNRLIRSAEYIKQGNLDFVLPTGPRDEIGRLSEAFNQMTAALRESRRSDRSKLERIQRATEEALRSLPDAVAIIDPEGKVEVATETARKVFGLAPGAKVWNLPQRWIADLSSKSMNTGRALSAEGEHRIVQQFVNGEEHYFRPEAIPILARDGEAVGVVLVLKDVTLAREQEEMKRGIISTVSHQLKTPLTSIRMAIHILLDEKTGSLSRQQAELLLAAREDSDRLHAILESLMDISAIGAPGPPIKFSKVSPRALVSEALERFRADFRDRGVDLVSDIPPDVPDVLVDPSRIVRVFANLLSNALRHTSAGGRVTTTVRGEDEYVRFVVADTGEGIPSEYVGRVFDQFFRVPDKQAPPSAGLGLAIVKEIVEAHGGAVRVESKVGVGSTFTFTLRRAP